MKNTLLSPINIGLLGLLVLASPDPQRFHPSMGTDVLSRIAELAAAALTRLH